MTKQEFASILNSIEPGLFDKYEANFVYNAKIKSFEDVLAAHTFAEMLLGPQGIEGLISGAFTWDDSNEGREFWENVVSKVSNLPNSN